MTTVEQHNGVAMNLSQFIHIYIASTLAIIEKCPKQKRCLYSHETATCSGLSDIPELNRHIRHVRFCQNDFPNISKDFMKNLSTLNLKTLLFESSQIDFIEEDSFIAFKNLTHFGISGEHNISSEVVEKALARMHCSLDVIHLERNNWETITKYLFQVQALLNVSRIFLSENKLKSFSYATLINTLQITDLMLNGNKLIFLIPNAIVNVRHLDLANNDIVLVNSFCIKNTTGGKSYFPRLRTLILDGNDLSSITPDMFKCLPGLLKLRIAENRFKIIPKGLLRYLPRIEELNIHRMRLPSTIESFAFVSRSLKRLYLQENSFRFDKSGRFQLKSIFKGIPNLQKLDLSQNFLPSTTSQIKEMLEPLKNITHLYLFNTALRIIPANFLQSFKVLETLILQGNYISKISSGTFENVTSLKILNLEGNDIHFINESSISLKVLNALEEIDLSNNPFICTCGQKWFRDWIRNKNETPILIKYPKSYKCTYPEHMHGAMLKDYNPTVDSCTPWNPLFTLAIVLSSFGVFVILSICIAYRCSVNIRNCLYLIRLKNLKRKGYLRLDNMDEFEFHAFVIYCEADSKWVHNVFLPRLDRQSIKLCIHMRDFDVGMPISENVEKYLQNCWKVVVIMSNSFAKSEWCQWETDVVQERRRQLGKEALILIMLQTIDFKHMTSSIKTLIKTTPYLTFKKGIGEDLFWKTVVKSIRRPLKNPPIAV